MFSEKKYQDLENWGNKEKLEIDWASLAEDSRGSDIFSDEDVDAEIGQAIKNIEVNLEHVRNVLTASAKQKAGKFYQFHIEGKKYETEESKSFFRTRARRRDNTIMLVWFRNIIMQTQEGKKVFSKELSRGKGFRYNKTTFKNAADWELEIINFVEDAYAKIREQWSQVTKLSTTLKSLKKLNDKPKNTSDEQNEEMYY